MMNLKLIIIATFVTVAAAATVPSSTGRCVLPIKSNTHWKVFWPLVFRLSGTLYPVTETEPQNSAELGSELDVVVTKGEEVILSCGPNYITSEGRSTSLKVKCMEDGEFETINGESRELKHLSCDLRSVEEVVEAVDGCAKSATSGKFGYVHPLDKTTRIIGESCYLESEGRTLFAHIRLGQNAAEDSISTQTLNDKFFSRKEFPNSRYKINFMKSFRIDQFRDRMKLILGDKIVIPHYQLANFVDIEHLISNKQFYAIKKLVWNYFVLFDSQAANLNTVRKDIVELSKTGEMDVYVGSHGIAQLLDKNGNKVSIYMDPIDNLYPIPKYIWFVIKSGRSTYAIAVSNDPSNTAEDAANLCASRCNNFTWLKNTKAAGFLMQTDKLVCCEYAAMRTKVSEIPKIVTSAKL